MDIAAAKGKSVGLQVRVLNGFVIFRGKIELTMSGWAANLFTLPAAIPKPPQMAQFPVFAFNPGVSIMFAAIYIHPVTGQVDVECSGAFKHITVDGVIYAAQ